MSFMLKVTAYLFCNVYTQNWTPNIFITGKGIAFKARGSFASNYLFSTRSYWEWNPPALSEVITLPRRYSLDSVNDTLKPSTGENTRFTAAFRYIRFS